MDTVNGQGPHPALDSSAPLQLVRAAAALRWKRPDLTATLAELAVDAADDAATWVSAAGWLLHGRSALGDGREVACDLLDGLGRWGEAGVELMAGPQGRRLRVELAGPARRSGEPSAVQALLAAEPGVDDLEGELRPDVLTELARCAIDDAPDTAPAAMDAAEQAWLAAGCEPGVASVLLLRAAHERRAGRPDAAVAVAAGGLARVNAGGRRAGGTESDHLAAALTAEWIAALVDVGRMDDARGEALAAAGRLVGTRAPEPTTGRAASRRRPRHGRRRGRGRRPRSPGARGPRCGGQRRPRPRVGVPVDARRAARGRGPVGRGPERRAGRDGRGAARPRPCGTPAQAAGRCDRNVGAETEQPGSDS